MDFNQRVSAPCRAHTKKAAGLAKAGHRKAREVKKVKAPRVQEAALEGLDTINLHAAGIDIGSQENFVAVPAHRVKAGEPTVRSFGCLPGNRTPWSSG